MHYALEGIVFLITHTPFWAVPLLIISFYYAYIFWLKSYRDASILFSILVVISIVFLLYYFIQGGPILAPKHFRTLVGY